MTVTIVLLPSPLLGPAVWAGVASRLAERGRAVATMPPFTGIARYSDVLDTWERSLPADGSYLLVPHSNAGLYVPAVGERRQVVGQVFVDAGIPPSSGEVPLAEPPMYRMLTELADPDGVLPPWTRWWDPAELAGLFPDSAIRSQVEREQSRLPLSYFAGRMPVAAGWRDRPSASLSFGDTYRRERRVAEELGWPTRTLDGSHLLMLTEPDLVASAVDDLLGEIGFPS